MNKTMTKKDALNQLALAANSMRRAIEALRKVNTPDALYYACELEELLSCDDGEAGLDAYIKIAAERGA